MIKRKRLRDKGKIRFSRYFQEFSKGDSVAVVRELALTAGFPKRIQGRTGKIERKQGKAYVVILNDYNQEKTFFIEPVHLKKIHVK